MNMLSFPAPAVRPPSIRGIPWQESEDSAELLEPHGSMTAHVRITNTRQCGALAVPWVSQGKLWRRTRLEQWLKSAIDS